MDKKSLEKFFLKKRNDFPIFKNNKNLIYFDNCATSQKPKIVIKKICEYYENFNSNSHRGSYEIANKSTMIFEDTRKEVSKFLNVNCEEIIFTKGATNSANILINGVKDLIKKNDEVILLESEHHSNLVGWQNLAKEKNLKIKYLKLNKDFEIDLEDLKKIITKKTKIISINHISNVIGNINNVGEISKIIKNKNKNILFFLDISQSIVHKKLDLGKINCDGAFFSGHKFFSAMGSGVLFLKKKLIQEFSPFEFGGNMISSVSQKESIYNNDFSKFEAGTNNISSIYSLSLAIKYIEEISYKKIENYERNLTKYFLEKLKKYKNKIILLGNFKIKNRVPIFSFKFIDIESEDIAYFLNKKNICIRVGHHCSIPLHKNNKITSTLRVSLCFYNTKKEIDIFFNELEKCLKILKK